MQERTLAIIKPDCMQKNCEGKVLNHLLEKGFKVVGMKMVRLNKQTAGEFYAVHKGRPFYEELVEFMTESPVIVLALQKENAVASLREVIGATDPAEAAEGTIRKLYAESKGRNTIHASDSPENAQIELGFFFSNKELIENGLLQ
jgi:nucleoside-diphosphate kinase